MAGKSKFTVGRPKKNEVRRLAQIVMDALVVSQEFRKHLVRLFEEIGAPNLRVVRAGSEIAGGLGIIPMGHYFGGRRVSCAGITLVGVSPQWRGRGAATALTAETVRELHELKFPISSLFAATESLYRKSGYDRALFKYLYELETRDIRVCDRECEMVPVKRGATKQFRDAYLAQALSTNGNLDRHETLWQMRHNPRGREAHRYLVRRGGKVEGYVVYVQERDRMEASIRLTDACILSAAAGRRILTFFADHATMVKKVHWAGGPNDAMLELLGENKFRIIHYFPCMLRVVSVPLALRARGYPAIEAEVHLRVSDDLLRQNNGDFVLKVSGGRGTVRKGGKGTVRLDVKALAQLYTGRYSPRELALLERIEAGGKELDALAPVFAGPAPWLPDDF
jgi:predicted acetyltransferase